MLPPLPDQALAAVPVGFLRIVGLVLYWLLTRIAATERAKARLWQRQVSKYGPIVSALTMMQRTVVHSLLQSACMRFAPYCGASAAPHCQHPAA